MVKIGWDGVVESEEVEATMKKLKENAESAAGFVSLAKTTPQPIMCVTCGSRYEGHPVAG